MAKKTATAKKSKKAAADPANGMDIALPEDKIKYLDAQTKSLELQLAHRVEESASAIVEYESMKTSMDDAMQQYAHEKEMTIGLTRDMTRQYKGMQDDLLNKINSREKVIQELTDALNATKAENQIAMEMKDEIIREKDEYIKKLNDKMEGICSNFASMLRGALYQMKERIEVQSAYYNDNVPIQQLMSL